MEPRRIAAPPAGLPRTLTLQPLTFAFATAGAGIPEPLVGELSGVGGILLLALGLDLLDIRKFPLLDLTWSLPLLPLIISVLDALTLSF